MDILNNINFHGGTNLENTIKILIAMIKHHRIKEVLIIYILLNLGILFTLYGSILYSPALFEDLDNINPNEARMELMNSTKGALIAQDYEIARYNIGFDMLNVGSIFLLIDTLVFNYIISRKDERQKNLSKYEYKLRENGWLKGNLFEWLCFILFLFAFFTFFSGIFFYIIITSFVIGLIGFSIRKLKLRTKRISKFY